ncbi:MAG: M56 family metallopeptidase, partial [Lachnospiraceae bacterium]|nr:M56 family metallopeptidase [Lachnospiraceae bacterium]
MLNFKMNMPFYLMVFYGSIMIIAILTMRGLLKNKLPKFVFPMLWSVILLRLMIPFSLSSPLSMKVPKFALDAPFESVYMENTAVTEAIPLDKPDTAAEITFGTADKIAQEAQNIPLNITYFNYDTRNFYLSIVVLVYFAGLLATTGILLSQKYRYTKHLKDSLLVEHNETINTLLREMDMGHILVFTNDEIASPLVCGLLAPKIYLPTRMDFGNSELLRHILCHETMHIRRKDNWLKFVMILTLCIHWFNPLVWLMSKYLASDLEMACDEAVLRLYDKDDEAKKSYAFSLLAMAITGNRPTLLYSAFSKTEVEKRIQNVLHYRKASALLLAFSVCLVLSGSVVFATSGQAPFSPYLTAFCSSDSCRWGVQANLTRDIFLDKNAGDKAEKIIFDIMHADTTTDPDILEEQIINALSKEFHVETSAFA